MKFIKIHENDNVAVAVETIPQGTEVSTGEEQVIAKMEIPAGHKIALPKKTFRQEIGYIHIMLKQALVIYYPILMNLRRIHNR